MELNDEIKSIREMIKELQSDQKQIFVKLDALFKTLIGEDGK
jgi:glycerol-3-phosphate responsive antiterminator